MPASRHSRITSVRRVSISNRLKIVASAKNHVGKPVSHQFAKELLAGFAGAEVDKLAETKGMDEYDREKAKHQAKKNAENMYDEHYGQYDQYDPQQQQPPREMRDQFQGGNNSW